MRKPFWDEPSDRDAGYDPEYLATRDHEFRRDIRDLVGDLWKQYEPFCGDPGFLDRTKLQFVPLTWQMYVAGCLLHANVALERADAEGPDHKASFDGRRFWVECIAVGPGEGDNAAARTYANTSHQGSYRPPPDDKLEPRITGAIWEKRKQHEIWVQNGIVSADDPYVIAVYTGTIPDADEEVIYPRIVNLLYGLDGIGWQYEIGSGRPIETVPLYRDKVDRPGKGPISRRGFLDGELSEVSTVIASNHGVPRPARAPGRDLITVHNATATNPLPRGLIRLGREFWATTVIEREDHRPPLPDPEIPAEWQEVLAEAKRDGERRDK